MRGTFRTIGEGAAAVDPPEQSGWGATSASARAQTDEIDEPGFTQLQLWFPSLWSLHAIPNTPLPSGRSSRKARHCVPASSSSSYVLPPCCATAGSTASSYAPPRTIRTSSCTTQGSSPFRSGRSSCPLSGDERSLTEIYARGRGDALRQRSSVGGGRI
jgi:hypothetical protein